MKVMMHVSNFLLKKQVTDNWWVQNHIFRWLMLCFVNSMNFGHTCKCKSHNHLPPPPPQCCCHPYNHTHLTDAGNVMRQAHCLQTSFSASSNTQSSWKITCLCNLVDNTQILNSTETTYLLDEWHWCPQTTKHFCLVHRLRHPVTLKTLWKWVW
jgi:hypothetical protein